MLEKRSFSRLLSTGVQRHLLLEGRAKREKMSEADEAAAEVQVRVRVLPGRRVPVPAAAGAAHHFQVFFSPLVRVAN